MTTKQMLDLYKCREVIFSDIDRLLRSLKLDYSKDHDNIFMKCPVHAGSDNPNACSISLKFKRWTCWTHNCHEHFGKDIFGFVRGVKDCSFSDSLKYISSIYNLDGLTKDAKIIEDLNELDPITTVFRRDQGEALVYPDECILPPTCGGSKYFESRGFLRSTLKSFNIEDCEHPMSNMKNRAIIPIYFSGKLVGYIARSTKQWLKPKYLCSKGLNKASYLYNYDTAISAAQITSSLFIVEGQGDVWKMHEAGVNNCVGIFGKKLSDQQERMLLKSGATTLIVLTDNDQAGRESKVDIKRRLGRFFTIIFPKMMSKDVGLLSVDKIQSQILNNLKGLYV